jgi:hypothetical protein
MTNGYSADDWPMKEINQLISRPTDEWTETEWSSLKYLGDWHALFALRNGEWVVDRIDHAPKLAVIHRDDLKPMTELKVGTESRRIKKRVC